MHRLEKLIKISHYILTKKCQSDIKCRRKISGDPGILSGNAEEKGAATKELYIEYADSFNEWGILQIQ